MADDSCAMQTNTKSTLMKLMEDDRVGTAHELLSRLQFTAEYSRIMRTPAALLDVDAKGCFDQMQGNVTTMTNRRLGCKAEAAKP